jgi:hypothetical protein
MPYGFLLKRISRNFTGWNLEQSNSFYKIIIMSSLLYSPLLINLTLKIELLFRLCVNTRLSMALRMIGI